jgi:ADP-L-glycero-D-manno-heptose 6-epimerase
MTSMVYQIYQQLAKGGVVRLFEGTDGYGDGEQLRDFVYVKDAVKANLFFFANRDKTGIFNCGTGKARTFNAVAEAVIKTIGSGRVEYIPFPEGLQGKYQSFTQADGTELLKVGYRGGFLKLEDAVADYCHYLSQNGGYLI